MVINSTTIRFDISTEFITLLRDNLATSNVTVTGSFDDDISTLPQIVVGMPNVPRIRNTMGKDEVAFDRAGSIDIEIITTRSDLLLQLFDDVENTIKSNPTLLTVKKIDFGSSTDGQFETAGTMTHNTTVPVLFELRLG